MLVPCANSRRAARPHSVPVCSNAKVQSASTGGQVIKLEPSVSGSGRHLDADDLLGLTPGGGPASSPNGPAGPHQAASKEPVRLADKPQPRARSRRPVLYAPAAATGKPQAGDSLSIGVSGGGQQLGAVLERVRSGSEAGPSGRCAAAPPLKRVEGPLGVPLKTQIVRRAARRLQEQAAQLADVIPSSVARAPAPLTPDTGGPAPTRPINPLERKSRHWHGDRVPQLRLYQLNRQRRLRGGGAVDPTADKGAAPSTAEGVPADPQGEGSDAAAPESPLAGGRKYGRPPLRSPPSPVAAAFSSPPTLSGATGNQPYGTHNATSAAVSAPAPAPANPAASSEYDFEPPRPTRAEFEKLVLAASDLEGLRALYDKHVGVMALEEFVLVANQLANTSQPMQMSVKVWAATQGMLVELLQHITPKLDKLQTQEYVVLLSAVAKLRYVPPNDWIAAVLTQSKTRLYNASPANLTSLLRSLARIAIDPTDIKEAKAWETWMKRYLTSSYRQMSAYRGDELVKTLAALSELRYRPPAEWMGRFSAALQQRLEDLEAHLLSEAMLAFAALRYQPEGPFLRAYYSQLYSRLPLADDRDLTTYAQAAALLDRLVRQEFMPEFLEEVLQKLPAFKPLHIANLLNAMGRLAAPPLPRVRPPPGWTAAVAEHLSSYTRLSAFSGGALASAAWGLSALGYAATPKFLDDLLSASYGKLHTCGPTDLVLLLTALGNFGYQPPPGREAFWDTWMTEFEKLAGRKSYDTRGVCDLMEALARLPRPRRAAAAAAAAAAMEVRPPHEDFVRGVLRSTRMHNLRNTSPSRLAALAGALATMGIRPDFGFLYNYAQATRFMWSAFSMRDYATLLGAMVHTGTPGVVDPRWAGDFLTMLMCRMSEFDGPGLAATLEALQHLPKPEFEPSRQWLAAAVARAVELVRSPPPAQPQAAGAAAAAAAPSAPAPRAAPDAEPTSYAPLSFRPGELQGGVTLVQSPEGRMVPVQPMHPMTPELMLVAARALAGMGYRVEPSDPLAGLLRSLLQRNALLLQLQTGEGVVSAAATAAATPVAAQQARSAGPAAAAAMAFERASAVVAAGAAGSEVPRPLLGKEAAAELSAVLDTLLGIRVAEGPKTLGPALAGDSRVAEPLAAAAAAAASTAPLPGMKLPGGAVRTPEQIAQEQARREAKRARNGAGAKALDSSAPGGADPSSAGSADQAAEGSAVSPGGQFPRPSDEAVIKATAAVIASSKDILTRSGKGAQRGKRDGITESPGAAASDAARPANQMKAAAAVARQTSAHKAWKRGQLRRKKQREWAVASSIPCIAAAMAAVKASSAATPPPAPPAVGSDGVAEPAHGNSGAESGKAGRGRWAERVPGAEASVPMLELRKPEGVPITA